MGVSSLPSVHHAARQLSSLRHCGSRGSSLGRRQAHTDQSLHALLSPLGAANVWKETAEAFRTSWDKVFDAVEHVVTFGLEHRVLGQIDAIGVDEIQYAKGHKYLTLVYQIDLDVTRLLWVGRERTIESFRGFFTVIGDELASKIVFVCSDMWEPYLRVIREKCSEALHILDRFHIVSKMIKALDEVRAGESRHIASEGGVPVLKKSRWLLHQTRRESEDGTALPVARSAPLQPEDRTCLPS